MDIFGDGVLWGRLVDTHLPRVEYSPDSAQEWGVGETPRQIGSHHYNNFGNFNLLYVALDSTSFNAGSFIFPTNGQDFTITVPASLGVITGTIVSDCNVCPTFSLTTLPGTLTLSFYYYGGLYFGGSGTFTAGPIATTPEPGTLGLVAMGIVRIARRKLHQKRG